MPLAGDAPSVHDGDVKGEAMPTTRLGKVCCQLGAASVASFVAFFALVAAGQRGGDTFFSNPWLASAILAAAASATVAGAIGLTAVFKESERAFTVFAIIVLGAAVFMFAIAEISFPH